MRDYTGSGMNEVIHKGLVDVCEVCGSEGPEALCPFCEAYVCRECLVAVDTYEDHGGDPPGPPEHSRDAVSCWSCWEEYKKDQQRREYDEVRERDDNDEGETALCPF